jgi:hypothetical protein
LAGVNKSGGGFFGVSPSKATKEATKMGSFVVDLPEGDRSPRPPA